MKTSINILSPHPVMLKTLISVGDVLFGDVLTDRLRDVLAIHPGTFWFGDVLTGHRHFLRAASIVYALTLY